MVVITDLPPPTEGIRCSQHDVTATLNNLELGNGTLYIAESAISWVNNESGKGFSLQYPHISIHAISRNRLTFSKECLYLMIDTPLEELVSTESRNSFLDERENSNSEDDHSEDTNITEIRFIPENSACLEILFKAMSECQTLHPDLEDLTDTDEEEIDDEEGHYDLESSENVEENPSNSMNGIEAMEISQFEDADSE